MREHKTFYMDLEQNREEEERKEESFLKQQIKEQPLEAALDKLFDEIKIDKLNGMVQITMPEPTLNLLVEILSKFQKLFLSNESEQRIMR